MDILTKQIKELKNKMEQLEKGIGTNKQCKECEKLRQELDDQQNKLKKFYQDFQIIFKNLSEDVNNS